MGMQFMKREPGVVWHIYVIRELVQAENFMAHLKHRLSGDCKSSLISATEELNKPASEK